MKTEYKNSLKELANLWLNGKINVLNVKGDKAQIACGTPWSRLDLALKVGMSTVQLMESVDKSIKYHFKELHEERKASKDVVEAIVRAWTEGRLYSFDLTMNNIHVAPFTTGLKNDMAGMVEYVNDLDEGWNNS